MGNPEDSWTKGYQSKVLLCTPATQAQVVIVENHEVRDKDCWTCIEKLKKTNCEKRGKIWKLSKKMKMKKI